MRRGRPLKPIISIESITDALKSLDYNQQSPSETLQRLVLVDLALQRSGRPHAEDIRGFVLRNLLVEIITEQLNHHRYYHDLTQIDINQTRQRVFSTLAESFSIRSDLLNGWHLLFIRYVRPDLNLPVSEIAQIAHVHARTLQRYQEKCIFVLRDILIDAEWTARRSKHQYQLQNQIPHQNIPLVGRDTALETVLEHINQQVSIPIMISGRVGVGKSAFATRVVHHLIDQTQLDTIVWVQNAPSTEFIENRIWDKLMPFSSESHWHEMLGEMKVVVVIDGVADIDVTNNAWHVLLDNLKHAIVIITATGQLLMDRAIFSVHLDPLSEHDTEELIKTYTIDMSRSKIKAIMTACKGIPAYIWRVLQLNQKSEEAISETIAIMQQKSIELYRPLEYAFLLVTCLNQGVIVPDAISIDHTEAFHQAPEWYIAQYDALKRAYESSNERQEMVAIFLAKLLDMDQLSLGGQRLIINVLAVDWIRLGDDVVRNLLKCVEVDKLTFDELLTWRYVFLRRVTLSHAMTHDLALAYLFAIAQRRSSNFSEAETLLSHIVEHAGQNGMFGFQTLALYQLSVLYQSIGEFMLAQEIYQRVLASPFNEHHADLRNRVLKQLARIAIAKQKPEDATQYLSEMDSTTPDSAYLRLEVKFLEADWEYVDIGVPQALASTDDLRLRAALHTIWARSYQQQSKLSDAVIQFNEALTVIEKEGDRSDIARARSNLISAQLNLASSDTYLNELEAQLREVEEVQLAVQDAIGLEATRRNLILLQHKRLK